MMWNIYLWGLGKSPFKDRCEKQLLKVFGFLVLLSKKKQLVKLICKHLFILYYILKPAVYEMSKIILIHVLKSVSFSVWIQDGSTGEPGTNFGNP